MKTRTVKTLFPFLILLSIFAYNLSASIENSFPNGAVTLHSEQTITGSKTFTLPVTVATPTDDMHSATKSYVDTLASNTLDAIDNLELTGSSTVNYLVATPTLSTHAVNKGILPTYELSTGSTTLREISSWTQEANNFHVINSHTMCTFDNKMWVIGGNDRWQAGTNAEVKYSTNGIDWTIATTTAAFGNVFGHCTAVFAGKMWVIGGNISDNVWSSTNGINWSLESTLPVTTVYKPAVVYDNRIYVLTSPVYSSADGVNWVSSGTPAPWQGLEFYSANCAAVFNGKMWIGGAQGVTGNKIWSSTDGSNWTESSSIRTTWWGGILFEYADRLWAFGGQYYPAGPGIWSTDIWSSYDGVTWEIATSTSWAARNSPAYTEYNGKLWISGGYLEPTSPSSIYSLYIENIIDEMPETVTIPASIILTKPIVIATPTLDTHATTKSYVDTHNATSTAHNATTLASEAYVTGYAAKLAGDAAQDFSALGLTVAGNTAADRGSVLISSNDPSVRFKTTLGNSITDKKQFELRYVSNDQIITGENSFFQLRSINDANSAFKDLLQIAHTSGNASFSGDVRATSFTLGGNLKTGSNWISGDGGNEGIYVDGSGNVGINLAQLDDKFSVYKSSSAGCASFENGYNSDEPYGVCTLRRSRADSGVMKAGNGAYFVFQHKGASSYGNAAAIGGVWENDQTNDTTDRNGAITFDTAYQGSVAARMRITSGGELLIATTTDAGDYKLQVNGNAYVNGTIQGAHVASDTSPGIGLTLELATCTLVFKDGLLVTHTAK